MKDKEKTALFIGNRDCYQVKVTDIEQAITKAIEDGIEIFLNGGQGYFDMLSVHQKYHRHAVSGFQGVQR